MSQPEKFVWASDPARSAQRSPAYVLLAGIVLLALYSIPLFSTVLPPLFDYPNHLARFAILAAGGNEFYEVRWAPLPNLAGDLIVPLLARAMPLEIAAKLFVILIFALILAGVAWLNRIIAGIWRFWPLLAAAFLYNLQLRWGFLNFLFCKRHPYPFCGIPGHPCWFLGFRVKCPCPSLFVLRTAIELGSNFGSKPFAGCSAHIPKGSQARVGGMGTLAIG